MKIKTLYGLCLFTLFFVLFASNSNTVKAAEGECAKEPCFVPAPTIVLPQQNSATNNLRPIITGLTWKTTKVNIYVDNVLVENVNLIKHEDYYASFSVKLNKDLKPGKHTVYAFAQDEKNGWGGVSKESKHTSFNIVVAKNATNDKKVVKIIEANKPKKEVIENTVIKNYEVIGTTTSEKITNNDDQNLVNELPPLKIVDVPAVKNNNKKSIFDVIEKNMQNYVEVSQDKDAGNISVTTTDSRQLGGGTSELNQENNNVDLQPAANNDQVKDTFEVKKIEDYQRRLKTNRIVGFVILAGMALILLFWLLLKEPVFSEELKENNISNGIKDNVDNENNNDEEVK